MFSLACNLLKMDAYSNGFQKTFLVKNPSSDQKFSSVASVNIILFLLNRKDIKDQILNITTNDTSFYAATTSQRRQSHLGASCYIARTYH